MTVPGIKRIGVIGAGNMGHQIAVLAAIRGFEVRCTDRDTKVLAAADAFADTYLEGRVAKGRLTADEAAAARSRVVFEPELARAVGEADYVVEAVVEVLDVKRVLFAELDRLAPSHAILATNSSTIVSSKIADATRRPDKVLNFHFFNPALVMKLVEVVQGPHVAPETADVSMALADALGKVPVLLHKEVEAFLLNRIFGAITREAFWLLETGVASFEDIDRACVLGAGHPMGPFQLMDLTGLDLGYTQMIERYRATGDPWSMPPPSLTERYLAGAYGRKTGRGWYDYPERT